MRNNKGTRTLPCDPPYLTRAASDYTFQYLTNSLYPVSKVIFHPISDIANWHIRTYRSCLCFLFWYFVFNLINKVDFCIYYILLNLNLILNSKVKTHSWLTGIRYYITRVRGYSQNWCWTVHLNIYDKSFIYIYIYTKYIYHIHTYMYIINYNSQFSTQEPDI